MKSSLNPSMSSKGLKTLPSISLLHLIPLKQHLIYFLKKIIQPKEFFHFGLSNFNIQANF